MTAWTNNELDKIGTAEELRIAYRKRDGTLSNPVTIWVVRCGDDLYVRSAHGRGAAWFRGTQVRHEGRIWSGDVEKDVTFVDVAEADHDSHDGIDAAYRSKYRHQPEQFVTPVVNAESHTVTIKLTPRATT